MRKEEWKEGEEGKGGEMVLTEEWETRQPGQRAVDPAEEGHHDRAVPGVLQADQPRHRAAAGLGPQPGRRLDRIHPAALHPGPRAVRPVEPREGRRRQAVRQARLHHGRGRGAAAGVPALRQGRDRFVRPAAQRQPRTAAGKPRREGDPRRLAPSACWRCWKTWPSWRRKRARAKKTRASTPSSTPNSARCSRKAWARTSPIASGWRGCCASPRPVPTRRAFRWPTTRRA